MTLIPLRPPASLLSALLDHPLEFDDAITRSVAITTVGVREVLTGPVPSSSSHPVTPPSRKGKEPARAGYSELAWPTHLAQLKRSGAGLNNPSMACYANATLQVLLHTPPVLERILAHASENCTQGSKGYCMTCALGSAARKHWTHKHYSPAEVHNNLPRIRKGFSKHRQEDTHEFFRFVTDGLQASAVAHLPKNTPEKIKQDSWVYHTWGGQVRSRVVCSKCRKPSDTFDSFLDLSLDVNKGGRAKLLSMLQGFVREDKLEGENKYHCENCKSKSNAIKFFRIARAPPILTFHLKRFTVSYDSGRARAQKFNQMIDYPEYIDIAPYMIDGSRGTKYRLIGVTCHRGAELRFGHYTSYVRGPDGRWTHADDEDMTIVPSETALNDKTAYFLSYIRVSDDTLVESTPVGTPNITPKPYPAQSTEDTPPNASSKRKREEDTADRPFKRPPRSPSPSSQPNGSPAEHKFGYNPSSRRTPIKSESFYGKDRSKKGKRRAPMPFVNGHRKGGMIGKMRRK